MAKGLFFVAFAACLLVSGHALLEVGELLGTVTGVVENLTGTVTDVLNNTVPQLTKLLEDLVKTILDIVKKVLELVLKLLQGVVDALQNALEAPLKALLGLVDSLTKGLLPASLSDALKSALKLNAITDLIKQLTGTVTCVLDKVVGNLTSEVLKGVVEILKCANPLVKEVGNVTKAVEVLVKDTLEVVKDIVDEAVKCLSTVSGTDALVKIVGCVTGPLGNGIQELSKIIAKTTPKIQQALDVALQALQCIQNVIIDKLNKAGAILKTLADCASGKNIPEVSGNVSNYTEIAQKALKAINDEASAAVGSSSALQALLDELNKFKAAAEAASSANIQAAVADILKGVQVQVEQVESLGADPNCIDQANADLKKLAVTGVTSIEADIASIAPDAVKAAMQTAALNFELNQEGIEAAPNALSACAKFASTTDNSAQQCFDTQVQAAKDRIAAKKAAVNTTLQTVKALTIKTQDTFANGKQKVNEAGKKVINDLISCLGNKQVVLMFR